jgi:hypothetical protein
MLSAAHHLAQDAVKMGDDPMDEPTDPDAPSSPAQPAEEIPDWAKSHLQEDDLPVLAQPEAVTLAEKHKARRMSFRRLTTESSEAPEAVEAVEEPQDAATLDAATPGGATPGGATLDASFQEMSVWEGFLLRARQLGQRLREQSQRLVQRIRPVQAEPAFGAEKTTLEEPSAGAEPATPVEMPIQEAASGRKPRRVRNVIGSILWRRRIGPAFWTVASTLSLVVNIILIVILILLGRQLFFLKKSVISDQLINGLYDNFVLMDKAHIKTTITVSDTIQVKDTIPVVFDLPLSQKTVVSLTKDTPVNNATIYLNGQPVPLDLVLREGTELSIKLDMSVPVNQTVPVVLNVPVMLQVPVDIPLEQTELHKPFVGLQQVVSPFRKLLGDVPDSWGPVCKGPMKAICSTLRFK